MDVLVAVTLAMGCSALAQETSRGPLTTDDALVELPFRPHGRLLHVGDVDGDGGPEVALAIAEGETWHVAFVRVADGRPIRSLWSGPREGCWRRSWDAGGDVDGDGIADVVVGLPEGDAAGPWSGTVQVVSGKDGEVLHETSGDGPSTAYGASVAFVGDLDEDGRDDYVVGAQQVDPSIPCTPFDIGEVVAYVTKSSPSHPYGQRFVRLADGRTLDLELAFQRWMIGRSEEPGYVSARSGRDGTELWRAKGASKGHAFGSLVRCAGDLDGDGKADVIVQCQRQSRNGVAVLSGATGEVLTTLANRLGPVGSAGDVDGDGVPDLFLDGQDLDSTTRQGGTRIVSGHTFEALWQQPYPDIFGDFGTTVAVGDLDGDGHADLALGEPNFNLQGPGSPGFQGEAVDLASLTLAQALALESRPTTMSYESGVLLVVSGRTRAPILGVWGLPGRYEGIGFAVAALPDVSGDGFPDLAVAGGSAVYVFAGPGERRE